MSYPNFKRYQPRSLRFWHWLNAFVVFGLLGTVLLRKTFLNWRTNSALIQAEIAESGSSIGEGVATQIAKAIRDEMWEWHIIFGFALAGLLLFRGFVRLTTKRAPFKEAFDSIRALTQAYPKDRVTSFHLAAVKVSHALFYAALIFMTFSGLAMYLSELIGLSKATFSLFKESHETSMWLVLSFVVAHIVGVVFAELTRSRGIVSDMINGGKKDL